MPETVRAKLRRMANEAAGARYDRPDLAWQHYREKRLGVGQVDATRLYESARRRLAEPIETVVALGAEMLPNTSWA